MRLSLVWRLSCCLVNLDDRISRDGIHLDEAILDYHAGACDPGLRSKYAVEVSTEGIWLQRHLFRQRDEPVSQHNIYAIT